MRVSKRTVLETAAVVACILSAVLASPPAGAQAVTEPGTSSAVSFD